VNFYEEFCNWLKRGGYYPSPAACCYTTAGISHYEHTDFSLFIEKLLFSPTVSILTLFGWATGGENCLRKSFSNIFIFCWHRETKFAWKIAMMSVFVGCTFIFTYLYLVVSQPTNHSFDLYIGITSSCYIMCHMSVKLKFKNWNWSNWIWNMFYYEMFMIFVTVLVNFYGVELDFVIF